MDEFSAAVAVWASSLRLAINCHFAPLCAGNVELLYHFSVLLCVQLCYRLGFNSINHFLFGFAEDSGVNMEEGSADAYTWDAPSHVIESIDDFALDPQDNADQWFGRTSIFMFVCVCILIINKSVHVLVHS